VPFRPPKAAFAALILGGLAASRFLAISSSPGEIDEAVFAGAVIHFDLFNLSPQAPGFPVWILIGRLARLVVPSPYAALALASTFLAAAALPALYVWGKRVVGGWAALAGTVLAAALPVVWVNGGRAFSDTPATAFFLIALALLALAEEPAARRFVRPGTEGRRERLLAIGAGLAAAAGAGVRPHLVLAFGLVLALHAWRLSSRGRADAALSFVLSGLAGTAAWFLWLFAEAGGATGLFASLSERAEFRATAFAKGTFGTLTDSFLVRDFLTPPLALVVLALALLGLASYRRSRAPELLLVLVPAFLSLWFLHSRAMSRYSVPFAMVAALAAAAGVETLLRHPALSFAGTCALAAVFARDARREGRASRLTSPPMAALQQLETYVHPGRETIVADDDFQAFLRLERWDGRLVAWGYLDSEFVTGTRQTNKRLVRLADVTEDAARYRAEDGWRVFTHGGRVAEALGNRRLLTVALRDPAPPIFGPGFGVKEREPGAPAFRWCGTAGRLVVAGLDGPPVALLRGSRPGFAGPTGLTVKDSSGRIVVSRRVAPGPFDLALVAAPLIGPLPGPRVFTVSCDRPVPLPPVAGSARPAGGCFVFDDATDSKPPLDVWERAGARFVLDVGSARDAWAEPEGFHDRERIDALSVDMRWTAGESSVGWVPRADFAPSVLTLRARAPFEAPVDVQVFAGDVPAGTVRVEPGPFAEARLALSPAASDALRGPDPVRLILRSSTVAPSAAGKGADTRALGIGLDRISLE
jgi:hypothetical protein